MQKKFLKLLSIMILVFTIFVNSADALVMPQLEREYDDYILELNWGQTQLAGKIEARIKGDSYPSYFGGIYISDDSKNVILQIVKDNIPLEDSEEYKIYNEIINMGDNILIEYVDNSYNMLNNLNNEISKQFISKNVNNKNVSSNYIDIINNKVVVKLIDNSEKQQKKFINDFSKTKNANIINTNNVDNSDLISFEQGEEIKLFVALDAGAKFYLYPNDIVNYCSMGFRTRYNGHDGFVTAGHCAQGVSSFPIGGIPLKQFYNNQYYDYAFVQTNFLINPSNTLDVPNSQGTITKLAVVSYCPTLFVNTIIAKSGAKTGYTEGKVTGLNVTAYYKNLDGSYTNIYGLVQSNVYADHGDSGAPIFIPRLDSDGGAIPAGILSGGGTGILYFTDINSLPTSLQTGRY